MNPYFVHRAQSAMETVTMYFVTIGYLALFIATGVLLVRAALPLPVLSPMVTVLFVIIGTTQTWLEGKGAFSVAGFILYLGGWLLVPEYGEVLGAVVCSFGILIWFWGLIASFRFPRLRPVVTVRSSPHNN